MVYRTRGHWLHFQLPLKSVLGVLASDLKINGLYLLGQLNNSSSLQVYDSADAKALSSTLPHEQRAKPKLGSQIIP